MTTTKAEELSDWLFAFASGKAESIMLCRAAAELRRLSAVEAERDALLAAIPEGCTPADAAMLREANHQLAAERDALAARPAVPAGMVLVPVEVLEDAATAIGHFVCDHGWSAEDMQAMDNLDAYIARHTANAAPATPSPAQLVAAVPVPSHPEPQIMRWSDLEQRAIDDYRVAILRALGSE